MTTMNKTVKGWVAAGSSTTLLVGGLVLGAPAAVAAPDDATCLRMAGQFTSALATAGITPVLVTQLEEAVEAVVVAEEQYFALADAAAGELEMQLEAAWVQLDAAEAAEDEEAITAANNRIAELEAAIELALDTPEIWAAEEALFDATDALDVQMSMLSLDAPTAEQILTLFRQFLIACDGTGTGDPVTTPVVAPAPASPDAPTPVAATPAPAPDEVPAPPTMGAAPEQSARGMTAPAPTSVRVPPAPAVVAAPQHAAQEGMNPGLNMQTAATMEHEHPGAALVVALLVAGIAVPTAVAARMHRLQRP